MPFRPGVVPAPLMLTPRIMTSAVLGEADALSLITKPLMPPELSVLPNVPLQSIVIDLVIVKVPNPPGSRQSISPPAAVLEIAPAKVLHGAVRLHGLTSSPTPETQVRLACALAGTVASRGVKTPAAMANKAIRRMIYLLVCAESPSAVLNSRW